MTTKYLRVNHETGLIYKAQDAPPPAENVLECAAFKWVAATDLTQEHLDLIKSRKLLLKDTAFTEPELTQLAKHRVIKNAWYAKQNTPCGAMIQNSATEREALRQKVQAAAEAVLTPAGIPLLSDEFVKHFRNEIVNGCSMVFTHYAVRVADKEGREAWAAQGSLALLDAPRAVAEHLAPSPESAWVKKAVLPPMV